MKWTETEPTVSGYYWLKERAADGYCTPTIVKVKIDNDPDWPSQDVHYIGQDFEIPLNVVRGFWSGPIKPPKD